VGACIPSFFPGVCSVLSAGLEKGCRYLPCGCLCFVLSLLLGRVWTHPCFPTPKSISLLPNSYPPQYYPHPFTLIQWISRVNLDKSVQRKTCLGAAPPWPLHAQELTGNRFQRNQHQLPPKPRPHRRHRHTHHCATPIVAGSLPPTPTPPAALTEHEVTLLHVSMDAASHDSICYISLLGGPPCTLDVIGSPDRLGVDRAGWTVEMIPRVRVRTSGSVNDVLH
jgi:hypothetical protein